MPRRPSRGRDKCVFAGGAIELRCGDYREVLADVVTCDALVADGPYSERTHAGHDAGDDRVRDGSVRRVLSYPFWTAADVEELVAFWRERNRGWFACLSDDELITTYRAAYERRKLIAFQSVPVLIRGMSVRRCGDGPSSWAVHLNVARPKHCFDWGTLQGFLGPFGTGKGDGPRGERCIGGKSLDAMRAIIREYTEPGDLVVDPVAGRGTTLVAAALEGRRALGAEIDPRTFRMAREWISKQPVTPPLFLERGSRVAPRQEPLFDG